MATQLELQQLISRVLELHSAKVTETGNQLQIQTGRTVVTLTRPPAPSLTVYSSVTRRR